jgi:Tol biopolymer transport system component
MRRAAVYSAEVDFQAGRETSRSAVVTTGENISMTGRVAWSPDGRRIAFVRMGPASSATSNAIVLRDLRTGDEHQIAVSLGRVQLLEWPTSASVVVIGYDRGVESRYRVDLTTGKTALIDRLIGYDEAPQHSMETRRSYLIRVDSAMGTAAVVARDDGTTTDRVLFQERLIWRAALSPNGKHIGIVALPSATQSTVYVGILSATDSGHIRVVRTATGSRQIGNQLEWTPDSQTLAFVEHDIDAQTATLWKVGVAADTAVAVTTLAGASPAYAKISPDGSHVGYISLSGPRRLELWAMPNLPSSSRSTDRRP